jgi:transposase
MHRRAKVELFELLRREYQFGVGTIAGVARKFGVHRRTVRQAIASAIPPDRKCPSRSSPKLDPVRSFIDQILDNDLKAPRKQRHTARRIYKRLLLEMPEAVVGESTLRRYVSARKAEMGLSSRDVCVPQSYAWGVEAQVDWYEAVVDLEGERTVVQFFTMRSMASGAAFHRAYLRSTQQAFLEAHQLAFHYFGGVFRRLRYDNLKSAVKKILRGHKREQTERFILFRSHWQFEASFCNPAQGHEKGGVEGEVGYFRRNHLVPVPSVANLDELNDLLLQACKQDGSRMIGDRSMNVSQAASIERLHLTTLEAEDFDLAEESFCRVDSKGCVMVRTNFYSTPLRAGTQARVRVLPISVEVIYQGKLVARHLRCYQTRQHLLDLEHYLDVLSRKPGALAGSKPLAQWRAEGRRPPSYDQLWAGLKHRYGDQAGTRLMIELLQLGRQHGYQRLTIAIEQALECGATDAAAVRYFLTAPTLEYDTAAPLDPQEVTRPEHYARPLPEVSAYDQLLRLASDNNRQEVAR